MGTSSSCLRRSNANFTVATNFENYYTIYPNVVALNRMNTATELRDALQEQASANQSSWCLKQWVRSHSNTGLRSVLLSFAEVACRNVRVVNSLSPRRYGGTQEEQPCPHDGTRLVAGTRRISRRCTNPHFRCASEAKQVR